jgi:hypothetical protein
MKYLAGVPGTPSADDTLARSLSRVPSVNGELEKHG